MKTCSKCGEEKSVEEFHKNKSAKDGISRICKTCEKERNKAHRDRYRESYSPNNVPDFKICPSCRVKLPKEDFNIDRSAKDGLRSYCRECKTPRNHGLTIEKYREMMANGCLICGSFDRLCVDHSHECCAGKFGCAKCVRGILCHSCNTAIGLMNESPERLIKSAQYLERFING